MTGWNLPPGCSVRDLPGCKDPPCDVCGKDPDSCICPECPVCQSHGDPRCYAGHPKAHSNATLKLTREQHIARQEARIAMLERNLENEKLVLDIMRDHKDFKFQEGWYDPGF